MNVAGLNRESRNSDIISAGLMRIVQNTKNFKIPLVSSLTEGRGQCLCTLQSQMPY